MYFKFACSKCSKTLKVREENVGRKVRCPYCHHAMTIKAPEKEETETDSAEPDPWDVDFSEETESTETETKTPSPKKTREKAGWTDGTEVHPLRSAIYAVVLTVVSIGTLWGVGKAAFPDGYYLGDLFLDRGWVPFVLVFLMSWSIAILFLKSKKLSRQKDSMLFDLLPNELSDDITVRTVGQFTEHIRDLPANPSESFLINRVLRGLEHFRVLKSNPEVASRLASQSDIDATAVESSYTMLKVFIWAIPILGFIGTVMGISESVGSFSGSLDAAQDVSAMRSSLDGVTGGLATAFDTTLVALVMSLLVMFPASSMQKAEEDLLNWVDEYCNENLLKRLKDSDRGSGIPSGDRKAMQKAIDAAMAEHHAEFRTWFKKLDTIGSRITEHVVRGWEKIDKQLRTQYEQKFSEINEAIAGMAGKHPEVVAQIENVQQQMAMLQESHLKQLQEGTVAAQAQARDAQQQTAESQERIQQDMSRMIEHLSASMTELGAKLNQAAETQTRAIEQRADEHQGKAAEELTRAVDQFQEKMSELSRQGEAVQNQVSGSMTKAADSLDVYFRGLEQGLTVLNGVLERLGEQQVVIESHVQPRRRWGLFRRGNGVD